MLSEQGTSLTRHVLFVDDEPLVLSALRRSMRRQEKWKTDFALGPDEALAKLEDTQFDVVVSDLRMPGCNGIEFLGQVQKRNPDTVRLILTAYSSGIAGEADTVVHQVLSKPWDPAALSDILMRICDVRALLDNPKFRGSAGDVGTLPSVSHILRALDRMLSRGDSSTKDLADLISQDPGMTAKLLRLVNSAFFGVGRRISSVTEAVAFLGAGTVRSLVTSLAIFEAFDNGQRIPGFDINQLHIDSLIAARLAFGMFKERHLRDDAFAATLLKGVGKLVLASQMPDYLAKVIQRSQREERHLHLIERKNPALIMQSLVPTYWVYGDCPRSSWKQFATSLRLVMPRSAHSTLLTLPLSPAASLRISQKRTMAPSVRSMNPGSRISACPTTCQYGVRSVTNF
ncbi:MAG: HDOD domain-containing protein [Myxococcota bacterium]